MARRWERSTCSPLHMETSSGFCKPWPGPQTSPATTQRSICTSFHLEATGSTTLSASTICITHRPRPSATSMARSRHRQRRSKRGGLLPPLFDKLPPRPKRMRRATYRRLETLSARPQIEGTSAIHVEIHSLLRDIAEAERSIGRKAYASDEGIDATLPLKHKRLEELQDQLPQLP